MSVHQWLVIALNIAAFVGMVVMFATYGRKDVARGTEPPESVVDYREYRKI